MVRFDQTIEIARPQREVFEFLNQLENYLLWQSNLSDISATNGMTDGSTITFTQTGLGQKIKLSGQVALNNGTDQIKVTSARGPIHFESSYQLRSVNASTTSLTLENRIDPGTFFALAGPVLQHLAEVRYEADLKTLKAILEQGI